MTVAVLPAAGLQGLERPGKPDRYWVECETDLDLEAQLSGEAH